MYTFSAEQNLPVPRSDVFAFFSDPSNLEQITPDHLSFELAMDEPIQMGEGVVLSYSLALYGIPFSWASRIEVWEPPHRFVDVQLQGPYKSWRHEHVFEETSDGTKIVDEVQYEVPGWIFAPLIHWAFVRGDIETIFQYRQQTIEERFGSDTAERTD